VFLSIQANLDVVVDLDPRNVDFGSVLKGGDVTREVKIVGQQAADTHLISVSLEPLGARRNQPSASAPTVLAEVKGEGETRTVELSIAPDAPSGYYYGQLVVVTDNPKATHLTARVRAKVQASVVTNPQHLRFSIPESGGEQTQELVVRSTNGEPLEVLEVAVHHPSLKASIHRVNERRTKITVTCNGEIGATQESTALSIQTTSKEDPRLQVPVDLYRLKDTTAQSRP
jgi:hypothetical protein